MILVETFVAGRPRTKGSLAKRPNGTLYDSVTDSGLWRALMAGGVRDDYARRWSVGPGSPLPYAGAVLVQAGFDLPCDPISSGAGDLDKLARNLLDALGTESKNPKYRGGVIVNDNQVIILQLTKGGPATTPGVRVVVQALSSSAPHALDKSATHGRLMV